MSKHFKVIWEVDIDDYDTPVEAVKDAIDCFARNDFYVDFAWKVIDYDTKEEFMVDTSNDPNIAIKVEPGTYNPIKTEKDV